MDDQTNLFQDPAAPFKAQQEALLRRRKLAEQLVQKGMEGNTGSGYQGGRVFIVGNPIGNIASGIAGQYMGDKADQEQQALEQQQRQYEQGVLSSIPSDPGPDRQQAMIRAMQQAPSLRDAIKMAAGFDEQEANRIERGEQAAATREATAAEKEANRKFLEAQGELNRQNRLDVRSMPTIHISQGGGRGSSADFKVPAGYMLTADGTGVVPIPGGPKDLAANPPADKPLNEAQGNAVLFGARAGEADKVLGTVTDYSPMKIDIARGAEKVPGGRAAANTMLLSGNEQKVDQAQRDFINAILRKESGAAISQGEFDNARKQYFPEPGDSAAVRQQKAANRQIAIKGLAEIAGPTGKKAIATVTGKAPPVGTVAKGYRFKGGDPSNQANWELVK